MKYSDDDRLEEYGYFDFHTHSTAKSQDVFSCVSIPVEKFKLLELPFPENCCYSLELHPWKISDDSKRTFHEFRSLAASPAVSAIGEAGLDRLHGPPLAVQYNLFQQVAELAGQVKKPLVVHSVKCYSELINYRKYANSDVPWMIHGFNSKPQILEQLLQNGFYVSLGMAGLKRDDLMSFFTANPSWTDRICLETDDSGGDIKSVYDFAALQLNLELQSLKTSMLKLFIKIFRKSL
ncbi:MAG: TatD family hydrolase [Victivallaceae bacterium]